MSGRHGAAIFEKICDSVPEEIKQKEASETASEPQSDMLMWEFNCLHCNKKFETRVPRGPREEREMKCTHCGSRDIERINIKKLQDPTCGG